MTSPTWALSRPDGVSSVVLHGQGRLTLIPGTTPVRVIEKRRVISCLNELFILCWSKQRVVLEVFYVKGWGDVEMFCETCMYVYIYIYMYIFMYVCMYVCMFYVCMYVCIDK